MLTLSRGLAQLRPYFTDENRDLFRVLLNATSAAEANLALQVLSPSVPEKTLVTACNLREVLRGAAGVAVPDARRRADAHQNGELGQAHGNAGQDAARRSGSSS